MTPRAQILLENMKEDLEELKSDCWTDKTREKHEKVQQELGLLEEALQEV